MRHVSDDTAPTISATTKLEEDAMAIDTTDYRRTDHERQDPPSITNNVGPSDAQPEEAGKALETDDAAMVMQVSESKPELDRLRGDVGSPYLLRRTRKPPQLP